MQHQCRFLRHSVFTTLPHTCTSGLGYFYICSVLRQLRQNKFLSKAHLLCVMDAYTYEKRLADLCRLLSTFRISSINYYLVCSLSIHKICVLRGIFSAISVLLTTENSDDRVRDGPRSLKVTLANSSCIISY